MARFDSKVIVVTGASRGIGGSIAEAFCAKGATVVGLARTENKDITGDLAKRFIPIAYDLGNASAEQLQKLVADTVKRTGRIDGLVNNAGIIRRAPSVDFTEKDWDDVLRVNLTSPFFLTQAVARWWLKDGGREKAGGCRLKIVNIASMLSFQGGITIPAYTASKHGIAGITKALANEWAPLAINVNAIAPGYIATENTRPLRENETRNRQILERIRRAAGATRPPSPAPAMFLASKDADYLNGAVINVDGGWLAR
jgi:2-deoxy-D-gluconate 3-dehydrogenase